MFSVRLAKWNTPVKRYIFVKEILSLALFLSFSRASVRSLYVFVSFVLLFLYSVSFPVSYYFYCFFSFALENNCNCHILFHHSLFIQQNSVHWIYYNLSTHNIIVFNCLFLFTTLYILRPQQIQIVHWIFSRTFLTITSVFNMFAIFFEIVLR